jgi:hypothetical protein
MGTTSAVLHIAISAASPNVSDAVVKAYAKIGWAPPRRGETPQRHATLARSGAYVSIHDSDCADLDDGTLKELAALLSRSLHTAAIVTTVYDSDSFEFILYHNGKQVDAVTDGSDGLDTSLKSVRGRRQANLWADVFGYNHFMRITTESSDRPTDRIGVFVAKARAAAAVESVFADDRLAAWCRLAALPIEAAVATAEQAEAEGRGFARLALAARAIAAKPNGGMPAGRQLSFVLSEEDYPYHGFFPAVWPCEPLTRQDFTWPVACRGGGLKRFLLSLRLERSAVFAISHINVRALSFHNGQVMSDKALAEVDYAVPADLVSSADEITLNALDFNLRDPAPGSKAQALLLIRVSVQTPNAGEIRIAPSLQADEDATPLQLPGLHLAVAVPNWMPIVADPDELNGERLTALLCLNAPSIHTAAAIVPDTEVEARATVRALMERLLSRCAAARLEVTVRTEKHLTASFTIPKSRQTLPAQELARSTLWPKLFDPATGYQTVRLGIAPAGAPWALAGISMQTNLRGGRLLGLAGRTGETETLNVAFWANATAEALATLALDWPAALEDFMQWARGAQPLQGWVADCAWIPIFDSYEDFHMTPYEVVGLTETVRTLTRQGRIDASWLFRRLKFVSPRLWLGADLAERVDRAALSEVVDIRLASTALELTLKQGVSLGRLERALRPILPFAP